MKYLFFALVLVVLVFSSCLLSSYIIAEYDIEIIGSSQARLIINDCDCGFVELPYTRHLIYDNQGYSELRSIQIWSTEIVELNVYKNGVLIYNKMSNYILVNYIS